METLRTTSKRALIILCAITLVGGTPLSVSAQAATDSQPAASSEKTEEKKQPNYYYNEKTGRWDSDEYVYNPTSNAYEAVVPPPKVTPPSSQAAPNAPASISETGPGSNNQQSNNAQANSAATANNNLGVNNQTSAAAISGNGTVSSNTSAGSAATGDAQSIANIMNMLQSSTTFGSQGMVTFQQDINGDVVGDILLNPELIFNVGPNSQNSSQNNQSSDATLDVNTNASINNQVDLTAQSGDASVTNNTQAGDATTGDAYVMANVVNVLNSVIAANQSFMGLINIYGNLDGDILFPPETINKLLTSNVPTSSVAIDNVTGDITLNAANNQSTTNNINLQATSGAANVSGNTAAGNATTGGAKTNLTVLNLTGREVIGSNSILVFVNVLGTWMGMIMDAPSGATAAALGGGITENNQSVTAEANVTNNASINNNLNLTANTGDASVTGNTSAGNATTGDAYAAANVANINNSSLNLSNWFGLLFINVFGSWNGSFGLDTAAGTRTAQTGGFGSGSDQSQPTAPQVFGFAAARKTTQSTQRNNSGIVLAQTDMNEVDGSGAVLGQTSTQPNQTTPPKGGTEELAEATKSNTRSIMTMAGSGLIIGLGLLGADKAAGLRSKRRITKQTPSTMTPAEPLE